MASEPGGPLERAGVVVTSYVFTFVCPILTLRIHFHYTRFLPLRQDE